MLKKGGSTVILDTSPGRSKLVRVLFKVYFRTIMPLLVGVMMTDYEAYKYLQRSTIIFLSANDLKRLLDEVGFEKTRFVYRMMSTIAIHWGKKPVI